LLTLQHNNYRTITPQHSVPKALTFSASKPDDKPPSFDVTIKGRLTMDTAGDLRTTLNKMANEILALAKGNPEVLAKHPIRIVINSTGGQVIAGNMLTTAIQAIKDKGVIVHTYTDRAYSAAADIAIMGSHRYISPYGRLLIHQPSAVFDKEEKCYPNELDQLTGRLNDDATDNLNFILTHANAQLTRDLLKSKIDLGQSWILKPTEAIQYGLIDAVKAIDF
jgi:ATP-dependent protease ClpP protease subunit